MALMAENMREDDNVLLTGDALEDYKFVWQRRNDYPRLLLLKSVIFGVILVPIRVVLLLFLHMIFLSVLSLIMVWGGMNKAGGKRKFLFRWTVWLWLRLVLFLMGFLYIHSNKSPDTSQIKSSHIIIGNHCGWVEIVFMMAQFMPSIVAKRAISEMPVIGPITKAINCIFVDRIKTDVVDPNAKTTTQKIIDHLSTDGVLNNLGMFPEGTTTNGSSIVHFRTGAFVPGVPVLPCIFRFKSILFDPCCCSYSLKYHMLYCMCQPFNIMTCEYLPVYYPTEEEKKRPDLYSQNVHKLMCEKSGLASRDDMEYADKLKYEASVGYKNSDVRKMEKLKRKKEKESAGPSSMIKVTPVDHDEEDQNINAVDHDEEDQNINEEVNESSSVLSMASQRDFLPSTIQDRRMLTSSQLQQISEEEQIRKLRGTEFLAQSHKLHSIMTRERITEWNDPTKRRGSTGFFVGST